MKKVAILQSNYIPWKGYFDLIAAVDEFVIYDDVQFTKNDWRNRNMIKAPRGCEWITIPVGKAIHRSILEVPLPNSNWRVDHLKKFYNCYKNARYYDEIYSLLLPIYNSEKYLSLSQFNCALLKTICDYLGIKTKFSYSWEYKTEGGRLERLIGICKLVGASHYVSGPSAKSYICQDKFESNGLCFCWVDYQGYPEYPQLWGEFQHAVSVLDLLFNCGNTSTQYMKNIRQ